MTNVNTQSNLLSQVHTRCREILSITVDKLKQKYREDYYVSRNDAELVFQRFAESDKELFLVLGDSGHGKTNLMCHLGQLSIETRPTLFLMGMWRDDPEENIFDHVFKRLKASLGHDETELWSFIRALDKELSRQQSWLLVIIDGINETDDPLWVKRSIREFLNNCPKTIRLAVSCRTDSFRLHFQEDFWATYVYQEGTPLENLSFDTQLQEALKTRVKSRFERSLTPEQRAAVESALARAHLAQQLRRAERLRELATEGSIFLSQFNELEFSTALSKYQITATLVGEALEQTHNPLVFKFFAETVGREAREVSDVFTLTNAEEYLKKHVREVVAKGYDQNETRQLLYRIANACREEYFKGSDGAITSTIGNLADGNLIDNFLEAGLLIHSGEAQSSKIRFTFDRVLSFVLAQQSVELGPTGINKRLRQLSRIQNPPAIDLHLCIYLLLFNEKLRSISSPTPGKDWIRVFLEKPAFQAHVIQVLPEFSSWSPAMILREITDLLLATPIVNERDTDPPASYVWQSVRERMGSLIKACADALATMARKGHALDVIQMVEEFLNYCPKDERTYVFHPLVTPVAVAFPSDPQRCLEILKQLCGSEKETNPGVMLSGPTAIGDGRSFLIRQGDFSRSGGDNDRTGISILQQEVSNFPQARLLLIMHLAASNWATFRSVAAKALPRLIPTGQTQVLELISQFANDYDFRVRASLAQTAAQLSEFDQLVAADLCMKLLDDRDERVRAALVESIIDFSRQGDVKLDFLQDALSDESTYIRSVLGATLIHALSTQVLEATTADLFKTCLRILAKDKSYLVRSIIVTREGITISKSPEFWIDLSLNALSDDPPPSFRIQVIDSLVKYGVSWDMVPDQANLLVAAVTNDRDSSVRRRAIYLLTAMAEKGIKQAQESLNLLVDDPELLVRLEILKAQAVKQSESLAHAILIGGEKAHTPNPRQIRIEPHYISALVDAKIKALKGRELIDRFLRNVSAVGLLIPFLILIGITGWKVSWLGYLGDDRYTSSPRSSFTPIIIGLFVATAVLHITRWLDLHYYSRRTVTILKTMWPYLLAPVFLSVAAGMVSRHFFQTPAFLLVGLGTLTVAMPISDKLVNEKYNLSSPAWSKEGIAYMFAVGYFSGVLGGWLAELTRESFHSFFMLVCPLLLSLRLSKRYQNAIYYMVVASVLVSLIPVAAYGINAAQWFANAQLYHWLANHFGHQAASSGILAAVVGCFFLLGTFLDDVDWAMTLTISTFFAVLTGLWTLSPLAVVDSLLAAILAATIVSLILRVIVDVTSPSHSERELGRSLLVFFSAYWLAFYGQPFVKSPWLLPGLAIIVVAAYSIVRWSYEDRLGYGEVSRLPLRQAIRLSLVAVPALCSLAILTTTALMSVTNAKALLSFTELSIALGVIFGLASLYFHPDFDFGLRSRVLKSAVPTLFVVAIAAGIFLLYLRQRGPALVVLVSAGIIYFTLILRRLARVIENLPLVFAYLVLPPIGLLMVLLNISLYLAYLGAFLILLSMWRLVATKTAGFYSGMGVDLNRLHAERN